MSHRGFPVTKSMRDGRRARAEERQAAYDLLTLEQKLERLPTEPAGAKVREKLLLQIQAREASSQQNVEKKNQKKNK